MLSCYTLYYTLAKLVSTYQRFVGNHRTQSATKTDLGLPSAKCLHDPSCDGSDQAWSAVKSWSCLRTPSFTQ